MITDIGLNQTANNMVGQQTYPTHIAIGTGSETLNSGLTALTAETDRNLIGEYSAIGNEANYIADFSALEISGTVLTEFGLFNSTSGATMFQIEAISGVTFDGSRELQIQIANRYTQP